MDDHIKKNLWWQSLTCRLRIRSKLFIIFLTLGLVPLLISGYATYHAVSRAMLSQSQAQLGKLVEKTTEQLDLFIKNREKEIELLSNYPFIQLSFLQFEFGQRLDTVRRLLKTYEKRNNHFNQIRLVSLAGKTILAEPETEKDTSPLFKASKWDSLGHDRELKLIVTRKKSAFHKPVVLLGKLVYDFESSTTPVGFLIFDIKLSALTKFVSSIRIGRHGYACLWDSTGELIYHPDDSMVGKGVASAGVDRRFSRIIRRIKNHETGTGDYTLGKKHKTMVFSSCRAIDWNVSISIEKKELMADILVLRNRMILFFSLLAGLLLVVSFFFGKSISTPVLQLMNGAKALGKGQWNHYIRVDSGDELQDLAHEFNTMAEELKKSVDTIMELKNFNEDILRSVHSGIVTIDRNYRITSCNAAAEKILGMDMKGRAEANSSDLRRSPEGEIVDLLKETLDNRRSGVTKEIQFQGALTEGELCYIEVNTSPLKNLQNHTIGAIAVIKDITGRKFVEEQMVRVDRLASLGELSAGLAHEIRNPLAGIKTGTQIMARKMPEASNQTLIQGILSEIERMNKLISDLLNFSRPRKSVLEKVDLRATMERSLGLVGKSMATSKISLYRYFKKDLSVVLVDREQMEQVFLNLLINGIKSMPEGGDFLISLKPRRLNPFFMETLSPADSYGKKVIPGLVEVIFQDTGCGMDREVLSKIFNPFFTTDPKGSGLGLSIVQKLVEKNRGYIHINSVPGQGTRVTLLFPAEESRDDKN